MPRCTGALPLIFGDRLRADLKAWMARRDEEWPGLPRRKMWHAVTRRMSAHLHDALEHLVPHATEAESASIDEFLLEFGLEPLRAFERARESTLPPDGGGLEVVSAVYGRGRKTVDVTQVLASRIVGGRLLVRADNTLGGDPAFRTVKRLHVRYRWKGRLRSRSVDEWETLRLP